MIWFRLIYFSTFLTIYLDSTFFYTWFFIEVNSLIFIYMLYLSSPYSSFRDIYRHDGYFTYFKYQGIASGIYFVSSLCFNFNWGVTDMGINVLSILMAISLLIKIGIPPFHGWVYKFLSSLRSWYCVFLLFTFQKLYLYGVLRFFPQLAFLVALYSLIVGSLMLLNSKSLIDLLISSSIFNTFWFVFFSVYSNFLLYLFFFLYSFTIYYFSRASRKKFIPSSSKLIMSSFILSLPPFTIFFIKLTIINIFIEILSTFRLIFISLFIFIGLSGYLKYFHHIYSLLYNKEKRNLIEMFTYVFPILILLFFYF